MIPHGLRFMATFVVISLAQELLGQSFLTEVSEVVHASIARFLAGIPPGGLYRSVFHLPGSGALFEVGRVYWEVFAYDCLLPLELHKPLPQIGEILVHLKLDPDFCFVACKADHSAGEVVPAIDGLVIELILAFLQIENVNWLLTHYVNEIANLRTPIAVHISLAVTMGSTCAPKNVRRCDL